MAALLYGIPDDASVSVDTGGDGLFATTWGDFLASERDGIDGGFIDPEQLASDMLRRPGCTAFGGGGASAEWSIRLIAGDEA